MLLCGKCHSWVHDQPIDLKKAMRECATVLDRRILVLGLCDKRFPMKPRFVRDLWWDRRSRVEREFKREQHRFLESSRPVAATRKRRWLDYGEYQARQLLAATH